MNVPAASASPTRSYAALGHQLRLQILDALRTQSAGVSTLARELGRPKSTIAYHLDILERAGLVEVVGTRRARALTERLYARTSLADELAPAAPDSERAEPIAAALTDSGPATGEPVDHASFPAPAVARPALELSPLSQAGVLRFIRYGFMPNRLGYCGPNDNSRLFAHGVAGEADRSLIPSLTKFLGPLPYLRAIAAGSGIADVFDDRVIEAYWVGNELLDQFAAADLYESLRERFRRQLPPKIMDLVSEKIPAGALPHHSFHVFDVWLRVGRLEGPVVDTLDHCRISWGRVASVDGPTVAVERRPLVLADGKLTLGPAIPVYTTRQLDGQGFVADVSPGDFVSLHWGWVCERLAESQARALDRYTRHHIELANQTI